MIPPTTWEILFLIVLFSVIAMFFMGAMRILSYVMVAITFIVLCIIAGFFMTIGTQIYNWMF